MRIGSLCSGYGGLEMGVQAVLGGTVAWHAEIDPAASAVLAARWPGVPNHGDLTTARWADAEPVDVLCAGFPCQPVSGAGRRAGIDDERWLFDDICAAVGRMGPRPRLLVFENVPGLLTANGGNAMARVVHGLARLGYVGSWRTLRASDIGAPHRRERVFLVAADTHDRVYGDDIAGPVAFEAAGGQRGDQTTDSRPALGDRECPALLERDVAADADGDGLGGGAQLDGEAPAGLDRACRRHADGRGVEDARRARVGEYDPVPDAAHDGLERLGSSRRRGTGSPHGDRGTWGPYAAAVERWERLTRPAPAPTDDRGRLSPAFVEWLMGLREGHVTGVDIGRTAQLRILGNGVVPLQAAAALASLTGADAEVLVS